MYFLKFTKKHSIKTYYYPLAVTTMNAQFGHLEYFFFVIIFIFEKKCNRFFKPNKKFIPGKRCLMAIVWMLKDYLPKWHSISQLI